MKKLHIKKVLAMFLAVALVVPSSASNLTASAATTQESNDESAIPEGYTPVYDAADLYAIRNNLDGKYIMMADIDLSEATAPGGELDTGNGWNPIDGFTGILDGNGHYIKGLTIYGDPKSRRVGLFGYAEGTIRNLGMIDVNINLKRDSDNGNDFTGAFIGEAYSASSIENCFVTGTVASNSNYVSGICSMYNDHYNTIKNVYNLADVRGPSEWKTQGIAVGIRPGRCECVYNRGEISGEEEGSKNGHPLSGSYSYRCDTFSSGYYLQGNSADDDKATPLTETQMKNSKFYTGFDFENT